MISIQRVLKEALARLMIGGLENSKGEVGKMTIDSNSPIVLKLIFDH